jgi:hypothetical protein
VLCIYTRRLGLRVAITAALTAMVAGCASSGATTTARRGSCVLTKGDSVFALAGPVYRDCAVDRVARLTSSTQPDFHPMDSRTSCYAADVEFVVDTTGRPETRTARAVHTTDPQFAESVLSSLAAWKYDPASLDGKLVRQIVASHRSIAAITVRVPAGSSPPSAPPRGQRPPSC